MHLEAVNESVRRRIMPGKAEVPVEYYFRAFERAVAVFGRGQVSTYLLLGLGDGEDELLAATERLIELGVYPFVVPFVPIANTPLEHHPAADPALLGRVLDAVARRLARAAMSASDIKAGCGRCGACSSLRAREPRPEPRAEELKHGSARV
jgi:radical SAM protein (TIGR04043 family)